MWFIGISGIFFTFTLMKFMRLFIYLFVFVTNKGSPNRAKLLIIKVRNPLKTINKPNFSVYNWVFQLANTIKYLLLYIMCMNIQNRNTNIFSCIIVNN